VGYDEEQYASIWAMLLQQVRIPRLLCGCV